MHDANQYSLMKQSKDLKVMVLNVLLTANEVISEEVFRFAIVKTVGRAYNQSSRNRFRYLKGKVTSDTPLIAHVTEAYFACQ